MDQDKLTTTAKLVTTAYTERQMLGFELSGRQSTCPAHVRLWFRSPDPSKQKGSKSQALWFTLIIPVFRKERQKYKSETSLGLHRVQR